MYLIQSLVAFLGRALLSLFFIASGIYKIFDWQGSLHYFTQGLNDWLAINVGNAILQRWIETGLNHAELLLLIAVILQVLGGLLVFLGIWVRCGAFLLILFLIPTSFVLHHFWQLQGPDRQFQMVNFMKDVSILGGLFIVLALGKGSKCEKNREKDK